MKPFAWSESHADSWEKGAVAGTGVVGAIVWGSPRRHVVTLAHERFFVPAHSRRSAPNLAPAMPAVRAALIDRDERRAADLIDARLDEIGWDPSHLIWTDPLGPIAELVWETDFEPVDYVRELALNDGGTAVSWAVPGGRAGLRILANRGSESITVELASDAACTGRLSLEPVSERRSNAQTVESVDAGAKIVTSSTISPTRWEVELTAHGDDPGASVSASATMRRDPSFSIGTDDDGAWLIELHPGTPVRIEVSLFTNAPGPLDVDDVLASDRCELDLGSGVDLARESVEAIWGRAHDGDLDALAAVIETAFTAGRRNVQCSTGALPPTLQGVWQGTWSPAWSADYTLNGNVQLGGLAEVLWTGRPNLMRSLFRLILPFRDDFRSNAIAIFGRPGMMLPARMTTHGHANHFIREYPHEVWIGHGAWFLRMAADYVLVTGDREIVDDWLFDLAREILDFDLAVLDDGEGAIIPSYSPENTPLGSENPLATNATGDIAGLRDGLLIGAWLAELRGDLATRQRWLDGVERLPSPVIATDGTLAEWSGEWPEQIAHRHVSQLQGLWYEPDPRLLSGKLAKAASSTIRRKLEWRGEAPFAPPGRMEMAFGLSSIGLAAAALGDSEAALQCVEWLARDHFTAALTSTHDAGSIFNLDASGALPAVVVAMLLGSAADELRILPALPERWESGQITGLTARGAVRVGRLAWHPIGVEIAIELLPQGEWLRPLGTTVRFPRPVELEPVNGASVIDDRNIAVHPGTRVVDLVVRWSD